MVVGAESESYRTLRFLVQRLPAMIAPGWLKNPTQPISIDDTLSYLSDELTNERSVGREIQIGGPDVLSYADMLDRTAEILGLEPRPRMSIAAFQHGQAAVTKRQVQITSARGHSREDLELAGRRA